MTAQPVNTEERLRKQINDIFENNLEVKQKLLHLERSLIHFTHHASKEDIKRFTEALGHYNAHSATQILNRCCSFIYVRDGDIKKLFNILLRKLS